MAEFNPFAVATLPKEEQVAHDPNFNPFEAASANMAQNQPQDSLPPGVPPDPRPVNQIPTQKPMMQKFAEGMVDPLYAMGFHKQAPSDPQSPNYDPQGLTGITSIGQGGKEVIQDMGILARDIGDHIGLTDPNVTKAIRKQFSSEKEQYNNIPYIKDNPIQSNLISEGVRGGAEMLPGLGVAKLAGLAGKAGTLAKAATGALSGASAGGIADPGQDGSRLTGAAVNAALGGVLGAIPSPRRMIAGAPTDENVAKQMSIAQDFRNAGATPTVGQLVDRPSIESSTIGLSQVPMVGGKKGLLQNKRSIVDSTSRLIDSTKADTDKAENFMQQLTQKAGNEPIAWVRAKDMAQQVQDRLNRVGAPTSTENLVNRWTQAVLTTPPKSLEDTREFRGMLDGVIQQARRGNAATDGELSTLSRLRNAIEDDVGAFAERHGLKEGYLESKKTWRQQYAYQDLAEIWDKHTPIQIIAPNHDSSNLHHGLGPPDMVAMTRELRRKFDNPAFMDKLPLKLQGEWKGLLNVHTQAAKLLRGVQPGSGALRNTIGLAAAGGIGYGMGMPGATTLGAGLKGVSYLLNSDAGRRLLTYAGGLKPGSQQLGQLTKQILIGTSAIATNKAMGHNTDEAPQ